MRLLSATLLLWLTLDRDRDRLRALVSDDLMVEWERRLDDFDRKGWHNRVAVQGEPQVEYVGLVNRAADAEDRVTAFVSATLEDYVGVDRSGAHIAKDGARSETTHCGPTSRACTTRRWRSGPSPTPRPPAYHRASWPTSTSTGPPTRRRWTSRSPTGGSTRT